MITGIGVPLEVAVLLGVAGFAAGVWAAKIRANRGTDLRQIPLGAFRQPAVLTDAIDLASRRNTLRQGSHAVLHGRIDQLAGSNPCWNADMREQVREHVAAVMRAGLRRSDRITLRVDQGEAGAEGFTIVIPGADERTAVRVADRLRRMLTQLRMPQLGGDARLTASFGVAADRMGETSRGRDLRARRALAAATAKGQNYVVPASEIEELLFLPAPAPVSAASAA